MSPQVDFQIHDLFIRSFIGIDDTEENFKKRANHFSTLFEKYKSQILNNIEKFSGYKYKNQKIPVYFIPDSRVSVPKSFTRDPLENGLVGIVQKLFKDEATTMHIFIHELAHVNQWHSEFMKKDNPYNWKNGEKNVNGRELGADMITIFVIREIFGNDSKYEKDFWRFLTKTSETNKEKHDQLIEKMKVWDLTQKSIKEYIKLETSN